MRTRTRIPKDMMPRFERQIEGFLGHDCEGTWIYMPNGLATSLDAARLRAIADILDTRNMQQAKETT